MKRPERGLTLTPQGSIYPLYKPQQELNDATVYQNLSTWSNQVQIKSLAFDSVGALWGGGRDGVVRWIVTPTQITFKVWHLEHGLAGNDVTAITAVHNQIICGHASGQLSIWENATRAWRTFDSQTGYAIRALGMGMNGQVLACTDVGLFDVEATELMETPEPALCAIGAWNRLWLGTDSGVWTRSGDLWEQVELGEPVHCVTQLVFADNALWLVSEDGLVRFGQDEEVDRIPTDGQVLSISATDDYLLISTSMGLFRLLYRTREITKTIALKGITNICATSDNMLVFGNRQELTCYFLDKPETALHQIYPYPPDRMMIQQAFSRDEILWTQSWDGSVWKETSLGWSEIFHFAGSKIRGVVTIGDRTLFGAEDSQGLYLLKNDHLEAVEGTPISFVLDMLAAGDRVWVLTISGVFCSLDGVEWISLSSYDSFPQEESRLCLLPDNFSESVGIVTSTGVYTFDGRSWRTRFAFQQTTTAAQHDPVNDSLIYTDGQSVHRVSADGTDLLISLPSNIRPIFDLALLPNRENPASGIQAETLCLILTDGTAVSIFI